MIHVVVSCAILMAIVISLVSAARHRGMNSAISLGIVGAAIYSVPAILNVTSDFSIYLRQEDLLRQGDLRAQVNYLIFWVAVLLFCYLCPPLRVRWVELGRRNVVKYNSLFVSYAGLLVFALQDGNPLFFLNPRDEQDYGLFYQLWRWFPVFAATYAFTSRSSRLIVYLIPLAVIFVMGDRTIPAITLFAVIMAKKEVQLNVRNVLLMAFFVYVSSFGKIIYTAIKYNSLEIFTLVFDPQVIAHVMTRFEPLGIYNHLNLVIDKGITADYSDFFRGVFGNLLVVPSFFGIDTNSFNSIINRYLNWEEFGLSGSYIAHWWVLLGEAGVFLGGSLYILILYLFDVMRRRANSLSYIAWTVAAALMAIYCHRNGIDNTVAFFRQIVIVVVILSLASLLLTLGRSTGLGARPASQ